MASLIRILGNADGTPCPVAGHYIAHFDPDEFKGRGALWTTRDASQAKAFTDNAEAMAYWNQQSRLMPTRQDGKPNKPLTAYTVDIGPPLEPLEEVRRWKDR